MTNDVELSEQELAIIQQFREQMANPEAAEKSVTVVNESLGQSPTGEKIQYKGGKPGWVPEPAARGFERWARREARRIEALEHAKARAEKDRKTLVEEVEIATAALKGRNAVESVQIISTKPMKVAEVYALAEQLGEARKSVLQNPAVPAVSRALREKYTSELKVLEEVAEA